MARYLKNEDVIRFSFKTGGLFRVTDSAIKQPATELKTLPHFNCLVFSYIANGCCKRRKTSEVYKLHDEYDVVKFIEIWTLTGWTCDEDGRK
jgi:hypothetical protein